MSPIPPEVVAGAIKLAKEGLMTILAPVALEEAKKYWSKDHGSKVKEGIFKDCPIDMFGNKACILVEPDAGKIVLLTDKEVEFCEFVKEKFRASRGKKYYYYEIIFKDGNKSFVRMSSKYRDAMCKHLNVF